MAKSKDQPKIGQTLIILSLLTLFLDLSLLSSHTNKPQISWISIAVIILINIYAFYQAFLVIRSIKNNGLSFKLPLVLFPAIIFSLIRLSFLDTIPRWDGSQYFQALINGINTFDLSLKSFMGNFNWYGHPTMGYAFITAISQLLDPTDLLALNVSSVILGLVGIFSFFVVCSKIFGRKNQVEILLLSTIFSVSPLFVSISTTFGPDFGSVIFFLAFLACFLSDKLILSIFFGCLLVFTKETGAYVYGLFVLGHLTLVRLNRKTRTLLVPLFFLLIYFLSIKFKYWSPDGNSFLSWGDGCRFCFGIKRFNIIQNLSVIYILNFNWIYSLVIFTSAIKYFHETLILRHRPKTTLDQNTLYAIIFTLAGLTVFFMIFVIYIMPRYMVLGLPLLIITFYGSFYHLIPSSIHRRILLFILSPLLFIQTFKTIDPVSKAVFGSYQFGNHQVLKIGTEYLADGLVYNTQYIYIQRLLDKFILENSVDSRDNIFIDPYAWGTFQTGWGHFVHSQPLIIYSLDTLDKLPDDLYFLSFPFMRYGGLELNKIQNSFVPPTIETRDVLRELFKTHKLIESKKIEIDGYWVHVYNLKKT